MNCSFKFSAGLELQEKRQGKLNLKNENFPQRGGGKGMGKEKDWEFLQMYYPSSPLNLLRTQMKDTLSLSILEMRKQKPIPDNSLEGT